MSDKKIKKAKKVDFKYTKFDNVVSRRLRNRFKKNLFLSTFTGLGLFGAETFYNNHRAKADAEVNSESSNNGDSSADANSLSSESGSYIWMSDPISTSQNGSQSNSSSQSNSDGIQNNDSDADSGEDGGEPGSSSADNSNNGGSNSSSSANSNTDSASNSDGQSDSSPLSSNSNNSADASSNDGDDDDQLDANEYGNITVNTPIQFVDINKNPTYTSVPYGSYNGTNLDKNGVWNRNTTVSFKWINGKGYAAIPFTSYDGADENGNGDVFKGFHVLGIKDANGNFSPVDPSKALRVSIDKNNKITYLNGYTLVMQSDPSYVHVRFYSRRNVGGNTEQWDGGIIKGSVFQPINLSNVDSVTLNSNNVDLLSKIKLGSVTPNEYDNYTKYTYDANSPLTNYYSVDVNQNSVFPAGYSDINKSFDEKDTENGTQSMFALATKQRSIKIPIYIQDITNDHNGPYVKAYLNSNDIAYHNFSSFGLPIDWSISRDSIHTDPGIDNPLDDSNPDNKSNIIISNGILTVNNGMDKNQVINTDPNNQYYWRPLNQDVNATRVGMHNGLPVIEYYRTNIPDGTKWTINYPKLWSYLRLWNPVYNKNYKPGDPISNYRLPYSDDPNNNVDPYKLNDAAGKDGMDSDKNGNYAHNFYTDDIVINNNNPTGPEGTIFAWNPFVASGDNSYGPYNGFNWSSTHYLIQIVRGANGNGVPVLLKTNESSGNPYGQIDGEDSHGNPIQVVYAGNANGSYITTQNDGYDFPTGTHGQVVGDTIKTFVPQGASLLHELNSDNYYAYKDGNYYDASNTKQVPNYDNNDDLAGYKTVIVPINPIKLDQIAGGTAWVNNPSGDDKNANDNADGFSGDYLIKPINAYAKEHDITVKYISSGTGTQVGPSVKIPMYTMDKLYFDKNTNNIYIASYDHFHDNVGLGNNKNVTNEWSGPLLPLPQNWNYDGQSQLRYYNSNLYDRFYDGQVPLQDKWRLWFDGTDIVSNGEPSTAYVYVNQPHPNTAINIYYMNIDDGSVITRSVDVPVYFDPNNPQAFDVTPYLPVKRLTDGTWKIHDGSLPAKYNSYRYLVADDIPKKFEANNVQSAFIYLSKVDPNSPNEKNKLHKLTIRYYDTDGNDLGHSFEVNGYEDETVLEALNNSKNGNNGKNFWNYLPDGWKEQGVSWENFVKKHYLNSLSLNDDANNPLFKDYSLKNKHTLFGFHHYLNIILSKNSGGSTTGTTTGSTTGSTTNPSTPGSTTNPSTPGSTTNPSTPGSTTNPSTPGSTTNPSTPGSTTNPSTPGSTTNPSTPGSTTNPSTPGSTTNPSTPGSTTNPSTPGSTTNPSTPGSTTTPSTPGSITNPSTPGSTTNPSTPGSTTNPSIPGSTTNPSTPGSTTKPSTPGLTTSKTPGSTTHKVKGKNAGSTTENKNNSTPTYIKKFKPRSESNLIKKNKLPQTGDDNKEGLIGSMLLAISGLFAGLFGLDKRRRRK